MCDTSKHTRRAPITGCIAAKRRNKQNEFKRPHKLQATVW